MRWRVTNYRLRTTDDSTTNEIESVTEHEKPVTDDGHENSEPVLNLSDEQIAGLARIIGPVLERRLARRRAEQEIKPPCDVESHKT
jgi:hypothetical protein